MHTNLHILGLEKTLLSVSACCVNMYLTVVSEVFLVVSFLLVSYM